MADPQKYAEWIVANADKKGTPEFDKVASAYAEARRLQNAAPTEAPVPVSTPTESVTKPRDYAASEVPLESLSNIPSSAVNTASNLAHMVAHPIDTVKGAWDAAAGGMVNLEAYPVSKLTGKSHKEAVDFLTNLDANPDAVKHAVVTANDVGGHMAARYGGWEEIKRTMAEDPVGAALDISALLSGGAGLARKAGAGPMMDAAANTRVGRAVGGALDATGNAVGSAIKYPVNKLVDVTGWTFDTMTGKRVPVNVGNKLREAVVEPNMTPTAKAEAVQNAINAMKDKTDVNAGQALADAGVKAPTMQALQQTANKKLDITSSKMADAQIAGRQKMMEDVTPNRAAAEAERKAATSPLYDEVSKTQVEAPLAFQQLIDDLPGGLERKTDMLAKLAKTPPLLQKGSPASKSMMTDPYTGVQKVTELPATPSIASGAGTKALIDYVTKEKTRAFNSGDANAGIAYDNWLKEFKPMAHDVIPGLKEADALYAAKSVPVNQSVVLTELNRVRTDSLLPESADKARALASELEKAKSDITQGRSVNALREVGAPDALMNKPLNLLSAEQKGTLTEVNRQGQRDAQMKLEAPKGAGNAARIMDEDNLRLDGGISVPMIVLRKVIKTVGNQLSNKAQRVMAEALQSGKSTAEAMQMLPASDRLVVLKAIKDAKIEPGALAKPAAIGNALVPTQKENKNALTK